MTVIVGLLIGSGTWQLMERSLQSLRALHPEQDVIIYYSLEPAEQEIIGELECLGVEAVDIGKPGLMGLLASAAYSNYNTADFNIKTSFKWLAILAAMANRLDNVIFVDADIKIISRLPFLVFEEIWQHYDILVQDEGNGILPKHPCTGFIGFKFCEANISLLETLHKEHCAAIVSAESQHDQSVFYGYIARSIEVYKRIYFLPQMLFPVGYLGPIYGSFVNGRAHLHVPGDPVIYHANWAVGAEAKSVLMDGFRGPVIDGSSAKGDRISYVIGRHEIQLPSQHLLPSYQASHPRYDRFLPQLARVLPQGSAVIDVGANCGDTLAAMASESPSIHYICIEADLGFFELLQANISSIKEASPGLKADAICALVGAKLDYAVMEGSGGTKKASAANEESHALKSESLDSIVLQALGENEVISLLKTDTDGWDSDVITSALGVINSHLPLLFFECQHANVNELDGLRQVIDYLSNIGYDSWFVFDNYGDFLLEANDPEVLKSLLAYVDRQNSGLATRTFYYVDVLAATPEQRALACSAVDAYVSEIAPKNTKTISG